ncbi:MAG TPA: DUF1570 domain-containing protein [Phycisphaerales bacterium]|nr:DUF1570 domain-containing protein [Phycisphaerales bacterium]
MPLLAPHPHRSLSLRILLLTAIAGLAAACSNQPPASPGLAAAPPQAAPGVVDPTLNAAKIVIATAPWTFEQKEGKVIETASYRIMTTATRAQLVDRIPVFMELALNNYTSAVGTLPRPNEQMESFILGTRPQWARMTQRVMGADSEMYLRIQRGGFSSNGRAILYDIGPRDTFAIAAHEGWHQYTQKTFRNSLPVTLEEGLATYMEGFRWNPEQIDRPVFMPWANVERWEQLRQAERAGKLQPLEKLMRSTPQNLMADDPDAALIYYAQAWALIHFLNDAKDGAYRDGFRKIVTDAANGRLEARVRHALASRGITSRRGADLLDIYLGASAASLNDEYQAFVKSIVTKNGVRGKIIRGQSPLSEDAAAEKAAPAAAK